MNKLSLLCIITWMCQLCVAQTVKVYDVADYGLKADSKKNVSAAMVKLVDRIKRECQDGDSIVIRFHEGVYNFHEKGAATRVYYISNHDQDNPKKVGLPLEGLKHFTLEGNGAQLVFHGRMLPVSLLRSENCTLQDFSIDFATPHITQVKIVACDPEKGIIFEPAPWVNCRITRDSLFEA